MDDVLQDPFIDGRWFVHDRQSNEIVGRIERQRDGTFRVQASPWISTAIVHAESIEKGADWVRTLQKTRGVQILEDAEPHHTHDCDTCRFLGALEHLGMRYDLYVCGNIHASLIGRYGSEGPSYVSYAGNFAETRAAAWRHPVLREVLKRAGEPELPVPAPA